VSATHRAAILPAGLFVVPLAGALAYALTGAVDVAAWRALFADAAFAPALRLSVAVGTVSTLLSLALALGLVTQLHGSVAGARLQRALGPLLAVPHAAFAVGFALLLMPSGLLARLAAPWAGWDAPPDLATVHDPHGIALVLALVLKETLFLLWNVFAQLQRADLGALLQRQSASAQAMGYSRASVWWRVLWPQLLPRLALPLLAVWAYGLTVVDMAIVLGPTRPPTLAVLAWQWLLEADPALQRQGAAAALLLTAVMAGGALLAVAALRAARPALRARWVRGDRPAVAGGSHAVRAFAWPIALRLALPIALGAVHAAVAGALVFVSFATLWTFPALWPHRLSADAWAQALQGAGLGLLAGTATLALASAAAGVALAIAWMETAPARWDAAATPFVFAPLLVPGVLLVAGLYRLALQWHLDGTWAGLWLAHTLFTAPYALIALAPAYRGFDARYETTARALGRSRLVFLGRIKWPMLVVPIAAAFAVGFAVSTTQYLTTQFVGAGRHATVTTEAIALASGGDRSLLAAFALLQALLPALVFALPPVLARRQARRTGAAKAA
jgi:putative thiamine transport system permease protein